MYCINLLCGVDEPSASETNVVSRNEEENIEHIFSRKI